MFGLEWRVVGQTRASNIARPHDQRLDGLLAQRLQGLEAMQPRHQHVAVPVGAHLDRRPLNPLEPTPEPISRPIFRSWG